MNRRKFLAASSAIAGAIALERSACARPVSAAADAPGTRLDLTRHRFGANYTPSHNWWFCWNDWNADPFAATWTPLPCWAPTICG